MTPAIEFLAEFRNGTVVHGSSRVDMLEGISEVAEVLPDGKYKWALTLDVDKAERTDLGPAGIALA